MWCCLAFVRDNNANIRDCQGVLRLDWGCSAQSDEDALCGAVVHVGTAAIRCSLDDLTALDQTLLPLIQHPVMLNVKVKRLNLSYTGATQKMPSRSSFLLLLS